MKRKVIVGAILVLAAIVGVGMFVTLTRRVNNGKTDVTGDISGDITAPQTESVEVSEWLEYPTDAYTISYPSSWSVQKDSNVMTTFISPLYGDQDNFREFYTTAYIGDIDTENLKEYVDTKFVPGLKNDISIFEIGEGKESVLTTNETINKEYDAYTIPIKCTITDYEKQKINEYYLEGANRVKTPSTNSEEPATEEESSEFPVLTNGTEEEIEEARKRNTVKVDANTGEIIEDVSIEPMNAAVGDDNGDQNVASETTETEETTTEVEAPTDPSQIINRTYTFILNDKSVFVFISSIREQDREEFNPIYDTAIRSFDCQMGISRIHDQNIANQRTEIKEQPTTSNTEGATINEN